MKKEKQLLVAIGENMVVVRLLQLGLDAINANNIHFITTWEGMPLARAFFSSWACSAPQFASFIVIPVVVISFAP